MENMTATPNNTNNLAAALAKAQGAIQNPKKDTVNPFFKSKYADLASVWGCVRPHLAANDLAFVQMPSADGSKVTVTGKLLHASGESLESSITGQAKDASPQSIGSCITYLRRYQLSAMLGIAAEEDDDGNEASGNGEAKKAKTPAQERPSFSTGISMDQHEAEMAAKAPPAKPAPVPQIDHGSFLDYIKSAKESSRGKTGAGKPWILYSIETEGHGAFSTFSATIFEDAAAAIKAGVRMLIHTEPTNKGPKLNGIEHPSGEAVQPQYEGAV